LFSGSVDINVMLVLTVVKDNGVLKLLTDRAFRRGGMETNCLQFKSGGKVSP